MVEAGADDVPVGLFNSAAAGLDADADEGADDEAVCEALLGGELADDGDGPSDFGGPALVDGALVAGVGVRSVVDGAVVDVVVDGEEAGVFCADVEDGACAGVDGVVALVVDLMGTVVVDVEGSGLRRRLPPASVALSRAGFSDELVSSVETCMLPVTARFGPRSRASPALPPVGDVVACVDSDLAAAVALAAPCCAAAASFFLASAFVSARRRPAALPARLSLPPER